MSSAHDTLLPPATVDLSFEPLPPLSPLSIPTRRPSHTDAFPARTEIFPSRATPSFPSSPLRRTALSTGAATLPPPLPAMLTMSGSRDDDPFAGPPQMDFLTALGANGPRARKGKADYAPALPPGAEWLLLTTAPPQSSPSGPDLVRTESNDPMSSTAANAASFYGRLKKFSSLKVPTISRRTSTQSLATAVNSPPSPPSPQQHSRLQDTRDDQMPIVFPSPRRKLNRKSKPEELPRSWEQFSQMYAKGEIDVENPPPPPGRSPGSELFPSPNFPSFASSPSDDRNYPAPRSTQEAARQRLVTRLDLFGKHAAGGGNFLRTRVSSSMDRSPSQNSQMPSLASPRSSAMYSEASTSGIITPPTSPDCRPLAKLPSVDAPTSMQNSPALLAILDRCSSLFATKMVIISVLTATQQLFLAALGMPEGVDTLPRTTTFCAHTLLNGDDGLVVLDTHKDWRFQTNVLSVVMGARFYAGVPIFVPNAAKDVGLDSTPIGSLCILDVTPRQAFSVEERVQLRSLASEVSSEVETWVEERHLDALVGPMLTPSSSPSPRAKSISKAFPTRAPVPERRSSLFGESPGESALEKRYKEWQAALPHGRTPPSPPPSPATRSFPFGTSPTFASNGLPFPSNTNSRRDRQHTRSASDSSTSSYTSKPQKSVSTGILLESPLPSSRPSLVEEQRKEQVKSTVAPLEDLQRSSAGPLPSSAKKELPSPSGPSEKINACTQPKRAALTPPQRGKKSSLRRAANATTPAAVLASIPTRLPGKELQQLLDTAVLTVGRGLNLSLAYLIMLDFRDSKATEPSLSVLASWKRRGGKLPSFSAKLHFRALQAPEGGLLYRNPESATLTVVTDSDGEGANEDPDAFVYASGILVPVLSKEGRGIILAGYTRNPDRKFTGSELGVFQTVSHRVAQCLAIS